MLTIKSDDEIGRVTTYEAIVKGEDVAQPAIPQSFHVLMKELQSLGLAVELENEARNDMGIEDENTFFGQANGIEDPLALLEGTATTEDQDTSPENEKGEDVSTSSITTETDTTSEESLESSDAGVAEDDQPLTSGDS